jgi:hypothetical protein
MKTAHFRFTGAGVRSKIGVYKTKIMILGSDRMSDRNREIDEAIRAGRTAIQALDEAESNISSARSFGVAKASEGMLRWSIL